MSYRDTVSQILASDDLTVVADRIRSECRAEAVAVLVSSADRIRVVAAAPSRYVEEKTWYGCADDCRAVLQTGLPVERHRAGPEGEPAHVIICPVDAAGDVVRGVVVMTRRQPFGVADVDFARLLGIELGAVFGSLLAAREAALTRRPAAGE